MSTRTNLLSLAALSVIFTGAQAASSKPLQNGELAALQAEVARLSEALDVLGQSARQADALLRYVRVDDDGNVVFTGTNVFIQSGTGATDDAGSPSGRGNLIIGYDEGDWSDDKSGAHNLVVGPFHSYTGTGGFVAGWDNDVSGRSASVSGGAYNVADGDMASVSGGFNNAAKAPYSSVLGGLFGSTDGDYTALTGAGNADAHQRQFEDAIASSTIRIAVASRSLALAER